MMVRLDTICDIRVDFTTEEYHHALHFVEEIKAITPNVRRANFTCRERQGNELGGKLAEVAFARYFGWEVDWTVYDSGDGKFDFRLVDGTTVDVKSVWVHTNIDYDYKLAIDEEDAVATFFVLVLIAPNFDYGLITGGISQERLLDPDGPAVKQHEWSARGDTEPLVVKRSDLSKDYPVTFWRGHGGQGRSHEG
jgi:hypothetical protein